MNYKNLTFYTLVIVSISFACSTKRILISTPSHLNDMVYSFKKGDSLQLILNNEIDSFPRCDESNNQRDSLKSFSMQYIDTISNDYFIIYSNKYDYDTISRFDRLRMKKENKETFKHTWKRYSEYKIINDTVYYIKKQATAHNFQKIYYDSISTIISFSCYTECDSYFKQRVWKPLFQLYNLKLMRLNLSEYDFEIKGSRPK